MRKYRVFIIVKIFFLIISACDSSRVEQHDLEHPDDKLIAEKLVIWWDEGIPHRLFAADAIESRYANTQFEFKEYYPPPPQGLIPPGYTLPNLLKMMRSDPSPDLIVFDTRFLSLMIEAEYLDPIPDTYGLEIDYDIITEFRSIAPDLELYALPFGRIAEGLFYNKAIFDERSVPYPRDGMTWDEVLELAAAVKKDQYSPIGIMSYDSMASQLSLQLYDSETLQFNFDSDEWKELTRILLKMNDFEEHRGEMGGFLMSSFSVGNTAMVVGPVYGSKGVRPGLLNYESNLRLFDVEWDIVTFPVFDDGQRLQPASQLLGIAVPAQSRNKEDAYKVMRYLLSHEVQFANSQKGLVSLRSDGDEFGHQFGASSLLAGKSVTSLLSDTPRGIRGPVFEFINYMNSGLLQMVTHDDAWRDRIVDIKQDDFIQDIPRLMDEREQFIVEMRSKY